MIGVIKSKKIRVSNNSTSYNYIYSNKNTLVWQLKSDTEKISNYLCNKATTTYEGRNYIAWYTTEIPIADGPYKFWGLPGLIIKIHDTENHYIFTLVNFQKYSGNPPPKLFQDLKPLELSYEKFKILNKEYIENPLKMLEEDGGRIVSIEGKNSSEYKSKKIPNPIERY